MTTQKTKTKQKTTRFLSLFKGGSKLYFPIVNATSEHHWLAYLLQKSLLACMEASQWQLRTGTQFMGLVNCLESNSSTLEVSAWVYLKGWCIISLATSTLCYKPSWNFGTTVQKYFCYDQTVQYFKSAKENILSSRKYGVQAFVRGRQQLIYVLPTGGWT